MLYKSSNILHKMFYSAMSAEILQICKATNKVRDSIRSAKILIGRIIKQRGLINYMKKTLLKLLSSHEECFIKFRRTNNYILTILNV